MAAARLPRLATRKRPASYPGPVRPWWPPTNGRDPAPRLTALVNARSPVTRPRPRGRAHDPKDRARRVVPVGEVAVTPVPGVSPTRALEEAPAVTRGARAHLLNRTPTGRPSVLGVGPVPKGELLAPSRRARPPAGVIRQVPVTPGPSALAELPDAEPARVNRELAHPVRTPRTASTGVAEVHPGPLPNLAPPSPPGRPTCFRAGPLSARAR